MDIDRLGKASNICQDYANFASVKLLSHLKSKKYKTVEIRPLKNIQAYSKFMIKNLYKYVKTDFVLTIQHDGFILNPKAWTKEFLYYDYIGAPWWYDDGKNVGNGGFSLRSRKLLKILANDKKIKKFTPEDHHICRTYRKYLESKGIKFAPERLAAKFSVEGNIREFKTGQNIWKGEFGFHDLSKTVLKDWLNKNPKYRKIIDNTLRPTYRI